MSFQFRHGQRPPLATGKYLQKVSEALTRFDPGDDGFLDGFQAHLPPVDEEIAIHAYDLWDEETQWLDPAMWGFCFREREGNWILLSPFELGSSDIMRRIYTRTADKRPNVERALLAYQEDPRRPRREILRWQNFFPTRPPLRPTSCLMHLPGYGPELAFAGGRLKSNIPNDEKEERKVAISSTRKQDDDSEGEEDVSFLLQGSPEMVFKHPSQVDAKYKQVVGLGLGLQSEQTENLSIGSLSSFLELPSAPRYEKLGSHPVDMEQGEPIAHLPVVNSKSQFQKALDALYDGDSPELDFMDYSPPNSDRWHMYQESGYAVKYPRWEFPHELPSIRSDSDLLYGHFTSPSAA